MNCVEASGKSVEEALRLALIELGQERESVEYEVIEEGKKGFLGIGAKDTVIRVSVIKNIENIAEEFLQSIFSKMNLDVALNMSLENEVLSIIMEGKDMAILIGKRGQTLDALQYLVSLVVNKDREEYIRINIDTENYRERRKKTLENLANKLALKVTKTRKNVSLEPMNPYERRVIHSTLQEDPNVFTKSEGDEPYRKVVICYNRKKKKQA